MFALGRQHQHAAGAGGEEVALGIDFQPVTAAFLASRLELGGIKEHTTLINGAIVLDLEGMNLGVRPTLSHVQGFFIRRQCNAVGKGDLIRQQLELAALSEEVHALETQFLGRIGHALLQAVWRIGEIQISVAIKAAVIGAVEPFALVGADYSLVGWLRRIQRRGQPSNAAVAVLAQHESPLSIEQQSVGAGLAGA